MKVDEFINKWSGEIIIITEDDKIYTEWKDYIGIDLSEKEITHIQIGYRNENFYNNVIAITVKE